MEELKELLKQHEALSFPAEYYGKTIEGVNLILVNSEVVGTIYGLIETDGRLSTRSKKMLMSHHQSLKNIENKALQLNQHTSLSSYVNSLIRIVEAVGLEYN